MYFKVYHKSSQQLVSTFNEHSIVDFCISNKESIKNYYFSTGGQKDLMEWEVFAMRHSDLFAKKAQAREEQEMKDAASVEIKERTKTPLHIIFGIMAMFVIIGSAFFVYKKITHQDKVVRVYTAEQPAADKAAAIPQKEAAVFFPMRRPALPADKDFTAAMPSQKTLTDIWNQHKEKLAPSLSPDDIKEHMDTYLTDLKNCYVERTKQGDKDIRGTINMKLRVAGDGKVYDVIFTDEKYRSTLFGDCLISAIKAKDFKMFKSQSQTFTYYYNL